MDAKALSLPAGRGRASTQPKPRRLHSARVSGPLLAGGVVGPALFVATFLIEGATRPGYSAWRNHISELSLGADGWMQIANFLVTGLLVLGFAFGLRRAMTSDNSSPWIPVLVGACGLGLIISGIFVTDPQLSYPAGAPTGSATTMSLHGTLHLIGGLLVFTSLAGICLSIARRSIAAARRGWASYSAITGVLVLTFFVASWGVAAENHYDGLFQRISIIAGLLWLALFAWRVRRDVIQEAHY